MLAFQREIFRARSRRVCVKAVCELVTLAATARFLIGLDCHLCLVALLFVNPSACGEWDQRELSDADAAGMFPTYMIRAKDVTCVAAYVGMRTAYMEGTFGGDRLARMSERASGQTD